MTEILTSEIRTGICSDFGVFPISDVTFGFRHSTVNWWLYFSPFRPRSDLSSRPEDAAKFLHNYLSELSQMPQIDAQKADKSPTNLTDSFLVFNPPTPFANTPTISNFQAGNLSQIKPKPVNPVVQTLFVEDDSESEGDSAVFNPMSTFSQVTMPSLPSVIPDSVATVKSQKANDNSSQPNTFFNLPQSVLPLTQIQPHKLSQNENYSPYFGKQTLSRNLGHGTVVSPSIPSETAHHPSQVKENVYQVFGIIHKWRHASKRMGPGLGFTLLWQYVKKSN